MVFTRKKLLLYDVSSYYLHSLNSPIFFEKLSDQDSRTIYYCDMSHYHPTSSNKPVPFI